MGFDPFSGPELESVYPSTDAQKEIWISSQIDRKASLGYNESLSIRLNGSLDTGKLISTIEELVKRHESLRAIFSANGSTMQILKEQNITIPIVNIAPYGSENWNEALFYEGNLEYDLSNGPLFRAKIFCHAPDDYTLLISAHHIICDGWSIDVLLYDIAVIYSAKINATSPSLDLPHRFSDFVNFCSQSNSLAESERFWKYKFTEEIPVLDLPIDYQRQPVRTYDARRVTRILDEKVVEKIKQLVNVSQSSLFSLFLTAWAIQLYRLTNQSRIVIGIPVAGQPDAGMEGLVGHCVSLVPILIDIDGEDTFVNQAKKTRAAILDAYEHRQLSFGSLLQILHVPRDPSRIPLIPVCFTHTQKYTQNKIKFSGCEVTYDLNPRCGETFELHLNAIESSKGIEFLCHYNTTLFRKETIELRLAGLEKLLQEATDKSDCQIDDLSIMSSQEAAFLSSWNRTEFDYPQDITLNTLLNEQLNKAPDNIAVSFGSSSLTLGELHGHADQLAEELVRKGVQPDTPVGILAERSIEMVTAILAVIKAGGAYVPLEPTLPAQRVEFMLNDIGNPIVLTQERFKTLLPVKNTSICIDRFNYSPNRSPSPLFNISSSKPDNLAYIIFTSGSTGIPKGVGNTHRGICNRLFWMRDLLKTTSNDRILQKTPFGFDVSVWEFFLPLITGAQLTVAKPGGHQDPAYLVSIINSERITCLHFVPSMLQAFLGNHQVSTCSSLRQVICSGEALSATLRDKFFSIFPERTKLINLYGPTEAAVDVTYWECVRQDQRPIVPIGYPVANTQIHILDKKMNYVPIGVVGELFIGGIQVARGYLNRPDLNKERFIPDKLSNLNKNTSGLLFRTGDLARWLPDGTIDFIGRNDFQVKIRGLRIELGEIENVLKNYNQIRDAVVIVHGNTSDEKRIIAYVVSDIDCTPELKTYLQNRLPEYMVPWKIIKIDFIPVTSNGKLDRKALPIPVNAEDVKASSISLPESNWEKSIASIWKELLKIPDCGIDQNFFDLGGHSLLLTEVQNQLNKIVDQEITMMDLFQHTTIRSLAQFITGSNNANDAVSRARERARLQRQSKKGKL